MCVDIMYCINSKQRVFMTDIVLICVILFFAAFIQASSGFGYAITAMAFLPLFLPLTDCMMISIICSTVTVAYLFIKYRKHVNYKIAVLPLIFCLAGVLVGLTLLINSPNEIALKILGAFLITLSVYFFFFSERIRIPNNRISASTAGLISGLTGGFFNIGGPPIVLFYCAAAKDKKEYIATLQFLSLSMIVLKFVYLWLTVGISKQTLIISPFGVVASVLGMILGMFVFDKLPHKTINRIVYVIMAVAGIWYVIR